MKKIFFIFFNLILLNYSENWWNTEWKYRKKVSFNFPEEELPYKKVGVINFTGNCKDNGEDIRVIDEEGKEVEYCIVSSRKPKYQILIPLDKKMYYIYYGNPKSQKKNYNFNPQCGLILEIYERKDDKVSDWNESKKTLEKSIKEGKLIGKSIWKKIWDATNPFGYQKDVIKIYTGYFYIEKEGNYEFATSSSGPSFLFIDDKLVANWPGWHPARPFITPEQSGFVNLSKGIHKLIYYHFGGYNYEICVAVFKSYDKNEFEVISEKFFIPIFEGELLESEKLDGKINIDFEWENINFLRRENWNLITYKFIAKNYSGEDISYEWDFGDGQKKTGKEVFHTYIGEENYNVNLTVKNKKGEVETVSYTINVEQDYSKIYLNPRKTEEYIDEFVNFNLKTLPSEKLKALAEIFLSYDRLENAFNCYKELRERTLSTIDKRTINLITLKLAKKIGKFEESEKICEEILQEEYNFEIFLSLIDTYIEMNKLEEGMKNCQNILNEKNLKEEEKKKIELRIADILRIKGEKEKATEIYRKYTDIAEYKLKNYVYYQTVLYYLKNKDILTGIELLDKWAEEFPLCKIEGKWSVLKTKIYIFKNDYINALREIEIFIKIADNENIFLPEALYLAYQISKKINIKEKIEYYKERILKEFPDTEFAKELKNK
ncbi:MAG TPA: PKD domain-containing protein [bacterium]|nr:PKD domain-containing protein [bacterium]HOM27231.1 PKD domain-containing protein [bacterium]